MGNNNHGGHAAGAVTGQCRLAVDWLIIGGGGGGGWRPRREPETVIYTKVSIILFDVHPCAYGSGLGCEM